MSLEHSLMREAGRLSGQIGGRPDLSPDEACNELGVCRATLYKLISDGTLKTYKLRRLRRIPRSEIQAMRERLLAAA